MSGATLLVEQRVLDIVADPMHQLTAGERTLLRKLGRAGPAISAGFRKGWMLDGTRYTDKALGRFLDLKLAKFWRDRDGVKLGLNDMGDLIAWKLTPAIGPRPEQDDADTEPQSSRPPEDD